MLGLRVAGDRAGIADVSRQFIALHSRGYVWQVRGAERLRNRQCVSKFVDFDDIRDVAAATAEPNDTASEKQAQQQEATGCDLPVTFAYNEVCLSLVPFAMRFQIRVALHANASPLKFRTYTSKCVSLDFSVEQLPCHRRTPENERRRISVVWEARSRNSDLLTNLNRTKPEC
jgi:hypothetical protein